MLCTFVHLPFSNSLCLLSSCKKELETSPIVDRLCSIINRLSIYTHTHVHFKYTYVTY